MIFLKKYKSSLLAIFLVIATLILIWPIFSLLTSNSVVFNFQLFILTAILIILLVGVFKKFIKYGWEDNSLVALIGLFFAILFFVSDAAQQDLKTIDQLTAITSYNCTVVTGILNDKDAEWSISYGYYDTDLYLTNLGFAQKRYGAKMGHLTRQVVYNMVYSNRLLNSIVDLNMPTDSPAESKKFIDGMKNQLGVLAEEIDDIIGCSKSVDTGRATS